jgi:hypothetical protein
MIEMSVSNPAIAAAEAAIARGDLLAAFDLTEAGLAAESNVRLQYLQVLALARMGATRAALESYSSFNLGEVKEVEVRSLYARLLKDIALASAGPNRQIDLRRAAAVYEEQYSATGDYFPGVNAASMYLLAGEKAAAQSLATSVLARLGGASNYWELASAGECLLALGELVRSEQAFSRAGSSADRNPGAMSTTRRQIKTLCSHLALSAAQREKLLAPLRSPGVAVYLGDSAPISGGSVEQGLRRQIDAALAANNIGIGYGSLAGEAEIIFAEALLDRGAELQVILPFDEQDFIVQSVQPRGADWLDRYQRCRSRATSVTFATHMPYVGDAGMYSYANMLSSGLANLRSRHLDVQLTSYAISNGELAIQSPTLASNVVPSKLPTAKRHAPTFEDGFRKHKARAATPSGPERVLRSIMFTDFPGFSKLPEPAIPIFCDQVMRRAAQVIDRHRSQIDYQNTWGDALYLIMRTVGGAAEIALELQAALTEIDFKAMGLTHRTSMRIALHYGPLYYSFDYVIKQMNFYGNEVNRAAYIEPVTPPGCVYSTEAFAAVLSTEMDDRFSSTYVGQVDLAKGYGRFRMYRIEFSDPTV